MCARIIILLLAVQIDLIERLIFYHFVKAGNQFLSVQSVDQLSFCYALKDPWRLRRIAECYA